MTALPLTAAHVTPKTARQVATTFLNNNGAKAAQLTDLTKAAGFPNLYIFNAEEGFVVMSADDCVRPILGYSLTGTFKVEDMPENISSWLQSYSDGIQGAIDHQMRASDETAKLWKDLLNGNPNTAKATVIVGPLIQTHWDQGSPYNDLCPSHSATGCVATAMAQVMKYWNYPSHGIGSHSYIPESNPSLGEQYADFNSTNYDWDNMTNSYTGSSTTAQKQAVATLMYHCGVSIDMDYGPTSGAPTLLVADALKAYFGYPSEVTHISRYEYNDADWIALLKSELDLLRPIQYHGSGSGGGHSFVCDGYDSDNYFHFNWGWSGRCDAYYTINNLNPGPGGTGSGAYGIYNDNQGGIFGVHTPSPACTASEPSGLAFTQNGRNVTLSWSVASGAASYNIYRDFIRINNTTANSFTETAPYGTHVYHVRSVDSNDVLSLSSNTITVTVAYPLPVVDDLSATLTGSNAQLTWTAPGWCYPETPSEILNYGNGDTDYTWPCNYYAHKHPASSLTAYSGMILYKISTLILYSGDYAAYVYVGTTSDDQPETLVASTEINPVSLFDTWIDLDLNTPVVIDPGQDLWIVIKCANTGQLYCAPSFDLSSYNANACYGGDLPNELYNAPSSYPFSWYINACLSDGSYTYNLYRDNVKVANNLAATTSLATLSNNGTNRFTVKTNYSDGETPASNMIGLAKGTATLATLELGSNDMMTLTSGSTLTVSGALSNTEAANLIIEDGAQLVHNTAGVKATVKKNAEAYTADDNGWYFIASPVMENITPSVANGLISGSYDLYYYNEPNQLWKNYKAAAFNLVSKQGYLYANNTNTTLKFEGTLTPSNSPVSLTGLSHSASELNGFNLVGNPFACNATINQDCYVIDGGNVVLASSAKTIAPGEGVFVKATSDEYTVTFSRSGAKSNESPASLDLVLTQKERTLDRVRVRLNEGVGMEKFNLEGQEGARLTISQNGQDYAVAYLEASNELPLNFKAVENGTYTLRMEDLGLQLEYLHLVDHLTGADIDLLQCPSYSFEAQTSDYEARFQLRFTEDIPAGDDFEFIDGKTQILDLTGRVVATHRHTQLAPGIYLLRTVNGNETSTQKIIIK